MSHYVKAQCEFYNPESLTKALERLNWEVVNRHEDYIEFRPVGTKSSWNRVKMVMPTAEGEKLTVEIDDYNKDLEEYNLGNKHGPLCNLSQAYMVEELVAMHEEQGEMVEIEQSIEQGEVIYDIVATA